MHYKCNLNCLGFSFYLRNILGGFGVKTNALIHPTHNLNLEVYLPVSAMTVLSGIVQSNPKVQAANLNPPKEPADW